MVGCGEAVLVVAAEAVDEAAVALGGTLGRGGEVQARGRGALVGGFLAGFLAGFGFAVEGLGDGGGAAAR